MFTDIDLIEVLRWMQMLLYQMILRFKAMLTLMKNEMLLWPLLTDITELILLLELEQWAVLWKPGLLFLLDDDINTLD
jgi:hypothetical protein